MTLNKAEQTINFRDRRLEDGCRSVGEFIFRGNIATAFVCPGKKRVEIAGTFSEFLLIPLRSRLPLRSLNVVLIGHNESPINAENLAINLGRHIWQLSNGANEESQSVLYPYAQEDSKVEHISPITISSKVTSHFDQTFQIAAGSSISLEMLRASNLQAKNRGIVIQLGLRQEHHTFGFLQVYVLGSQELEVVKQASIDEALLLWQNIFYHVRYPEDCHSTPCLPASSF